MSDKKPKKPATPKPPKPPTNRIVKNSEPKISHKGGGKKK